jgi:hypothetical protein
MHFFPAAHTLEVPFVIWCSLFSQFPWFLSPWKEYIKRLESIPDDVFTSPMYPKYFVTSQLFLWAISYHGIRSGFALMKSGALILTGRALIPGSALRALRRPPPSSLSKGGGSARQPLMGKGGLTLLPIKGPSGKPNPDREWHTENWDYFMLSWFSFRRSACILIWLSRYCIGRRTYLVGTFLSMYTLYLRKYIYNYSQPHITVGPWTQGIAVSSAQHTYTNPLLRQVVSLSLLVRVTSFCF